MREHDYEPVAGLPEALPAGEEILWQGAPDFKTYAYRGLHLRSLAPYFGLVMLWNGYDGWANGQSWADIATTLAIFSAAAMFAISLLLVFGYAVARSTLYTVTNRRVVMRHGLAVPIIMNIPFRMIDAVNLKPLTDGYGEIALSITPKHRLAYLMLWPHARPFHFNRAEPMFRALPQAQAAAEILVSAITDAQSQQADSAKLESSVSGTRNVGSSSADLSGHAPVMA